MITLTPNEAITMVSLTMEGLEKYKDYLSPEMTDKLKEVYRKIITPKWDDYTKPAIIIEELPF